MASDRIVKLLGMLGSSFEGERANAALIISNMAAERDLSIADLMQAEFGDGKRRVSVVKPQPRSERRTVNVSMDDVGQTEDDLRPLLGRLTELLENDRIDERDYRFVENVVLAYVTDADLPSSVNARVRRIVQSCSG